MTETKQPGVMIYFDLRPCLRRLDNGQKGALFAAIMDYAEDGTLPEFDDVAVGVAWDFIKPRIDRDAEIYAGKVVKAKAAAEKRWSKQDTEEYDGMQTHTDALPGNTEQYEPMPQIPTSTSTTTSTSTSTSASKGETPLGAAAPAPGDARERRETRGDAGQVDTQAHQRSPTVAQTACGGAELPDEGFRLIAGAVPG